MFQEFRGQCEKLAGAYARLLEKPAKGIDADLALPCFAIAKERRKDPALIAKEIAESIKPAGLVKRIEAIGPYVNFYADWDKLGKEIVSQIIQAGESYGRGYNKEKIMVEYSSPNTNKPLHVGHLRNDSIGMAISNILEFLGYKVIRTAIINDRGVHICKSMLAYRKWGKRNKPNKKLDHFVGDFYVMFEKKLKENPELEKEIHEMLQKWERGDKPTRALWKKMNNWVLSGMKETYRLFGSKFDFWTFESEIYNKAKPLINKGIKKGAFFKNEKGAIIAGLEPELPNKVILREDGTSVYITQDIVLAKMRFTNYKINKLIYVVATEQGLHFKQLFKILQLLGYQWYDKCYHLSYGLVNLPSGRMKTREGTVIDADDLIHEVTELAKEEVKTREKDIPKKELESRSKEIALAAIKYYLLRLEPVKDLLFDAKAAISFEGDTGPYLQYTYARAKSILRKSRKKPALSGFEKDEVAIIKKLSQFPFVAKKCAVELKPHYLANYLFELATQFNEFYHAKPVIGSGREETLLALVTAVSLIMKTGLHLLGIKALERM